MERPMHHEQGLIKEQAKIFKALGHPSRLNMVTALQHGELCVCDLQALVGGDMSTTSRHLAVLREAGVVSSRKEGTTIYYKLELCCLGGFLNCTRAHLANKLAQSIKLMS